MKTCKCYLSMGMIVQRDPECKLTRKQHFPPRPFARVILPGDPDYPDELRRKK